jgi:hypothetical protein
LIDEFPDYVSVTGLAIPYWIDDTTPPVSTHTLDPPEPDGNNSWYVSDVNVTLNATDDLSGVKEIRYTINGGAQQVIPGDNGSFILSEDGDDIYVEYWAIDNSGNAEKKNSFTIDIDQTPPEIEITYEVIGGNPLRGWDFEFTATATDAMSGVEKVEFWYNGVLQDTVYGPGPEYQWTLHSPGLSNNTFKVRGIILNPEITDENVSFYAIIVRISAIPLEEIFIRCCAYDYAGNVKCDEILSTDMSVNINPGIYLFENVVLPDNFSGYIGSFFIFATFNTI